MLSRVLEQNTILIPYCSDQPKPKCFQTSNWKYLSILLIEQIIFSSKEATASAIIPNNKVICILFFHRRKETVWWDQHY